MDEEERARVDSLELLNGLRIGVTLVAGTARLLIQTSLQDSDSKENSSFKRGCDNIDGHSFSDQLANGHEP